MPDYIFTDDLAQETVGTLPRYWALQGAPGSPDYRTTQYIRVGVREGKKVVEALSFRVYTHPYVRGPDFEQAWWMGASLCGLTEMGPYPYPGRPNLGVGPWSGEHVRLGLCDWGGLTAVTAQGCVGGQPFKEALLEVPPTSVGELHRYAMRLIPSLEFWFDGQLMGSRPEGAWDLGGPIRIEPYSDQWGLPGVWYMGVSFTEVELEGAQPHRAGSGQRMPPDAPVTYHVESYHLHDDYTYGRAEGWRSAVRRKALAGWEQEAELTGATHLSLLPLPDGRLQALYFQPADSAICYGPLEAGTPMLQDHYYPSLLFMPQVGLSLLLCYRQGSLYAFHGRHTTGGEIEWETNNPYLVSEGNVFPQPAALTQEPDGKVLVLFVDRNKQLQALASSDFGKTWT